MSKEPKNVQNSDIRILDAVKQKILKASSGFKLTKKSSTWSLKGFGVRITSSSETLTAEDGECDERG